MAIDPGQLKLDFSTEGLLEKESVENPATIATGSANANKQPDIKSQIIAEVPDEDKMSGFGDYGDSSDEDSYGPEAQED